MKIALAGNPNSGKTTLFNALTGKTEYVGNWAGVTVAKKESKLKTKYINSTTKQNSNVTVVDLPGAYSISPFTGEEAITRDFVLKESPDVIINIIDGSNFERSLFFTTQLLELNIPVVIAINKYDIVKRSGNMIDIEALSKRLNCEVIFITANKNSGLKTLMNKVLNNNRFGQVAPSFQGKATIDEDRFRQDYVKNVVLGSLHKVTDSSKLNISDRLDRIFANTLLGLPIFGLVMWMIYLVSIKGIGGGLSSYINDTLFGRIVPHLMNQFLSSIGVSELLKSLIVEGALSGVGAVLGFLPLIMVLFFFLALLEDSGYMARVAIIMDRYFKKIGLSGKSIIPMIVGTGCSIPGVMSTRTIENEDQRKATIMLTPFVPCGAKLPIIALFAAVFFPGASWVFPAMYFLAGIVIILAGLLLQKIYKFNGASSFIVELPAYKVPSLKHALTQMIKQAKAFIVKASTIILVMNTVVWFTQNYGWNLNVAQDQSTSILATIGKIFVPLLIPLGYVGWQLAVSALTGFVAKENVVATLAVILATSETAIQAPGGVLTTMFNPVTAISFLVFNLFTPPCFAAIGAMNAELGERKLLLKAIVFQIGVGYSLAMAISQIGSIVVYGVISPGFIPAIIVAIVLTVIVLVLIKRPERLNNLNINEEVI